MRQISMTDIAYIKSIEGSTTDVLLTNKSTSFYHNVAFKYWLFDCHKMILIFFRASASAGFKMLSLTKWIEAGRDCLEKRFQTMSIQEK